MSTTVAFDRGLVLSFAVMALAWTGPGYGQSGGWRPEKNVEIVAPANPGGLHDITARALQRVFQTQKLVNAQDFLSSLRKS